MHDDIATLVRELADAIPFGTEGDDSGARFIGGSGAGAGALFIIGGGRSSPYLVAMLSEFVGIELDGNARKAALIGPGEAGQEPAFHDPIGELPRHYRYG